MNNIDKNIVADKLRKYFEAKGISQNQVSRDTNMPPSQINNILNGKNYGVEFLFKIFNTYEDLDINFVLNRGDIKGDQESLTKSNKRIQGVNQQFEEMIEELKDTMLRYERQQLEIKKRLDLLDKKFEDKDSNKL